MSSDSNSLSSARLLSRRVLEAAAFIVALMAVVQLFGNTLAHVACSLYLFLFALTGLFWSRVFSEKAGVGQQDAWLKAEFSSAVLLLTLVVVALDGWFFGLLPVLVPDSTKPEPLGGLVDVLAVLSLFSVVLIFFSACLLSRPGGAGNGGRQDPGSGDAEKPSEE